MHLQIKTKSTWFSTLAGAVLLAVMALSALPAHAVNVIELTMEVSALRTIYDFELTPEQMTTVRAMLHKPANAAVKGPDKPQRKLHEALIALRKELVTAEDPEVIADLQAKVDEARDAASSELHDEITITENAKKSVPEFMRMLGPVQLARYLDANRDEIAQPIDRITETLNGCHKADAATWNKWRDRIPAEISILVAGLDSNRSAALKSDLTHLFDRVRLMSVADYTAKRHDLLEEASRSIGSVDSFDILRHCVEHDVAEFLSNPRLSIALDAKQKH